MKHTPGPWHYDGGSEVHYDNGMRCVADISDHNGFEDIPEEEWIANAHLIATSPELLGALEELLGHFRSQDKAGNLAFRKARVVIAKAKGET